MPEIECQGTRYILLVSKSAHPLATCSLPGPMQQLLASGFLLGIANRKGVMMKPGIWTSDSPQGGMSDCVPQWRVGLICNTAFSIWPFFSRLQKSLPLPWPGAGYPTATSNADCFIFGCFS